MARNGVCPDLDLNLLIGRRTEVCNTVKKSKNKEKVKESMPEVRVEWNKMDETKYRVTAYISIINVLSPRIFKSGIL
jgi:hypothetical protein